jgi:hypothetical protein
VELRRPLDPLTVDPRAVSAAQVPQQKTVGRSFDLGMMPADFAKRNKQVPDVAVTLTPKLAARFLHWIHPAVGSPGDDR